MHVFALMELVNSADRDGYRGKVRKSAAPPTWGMTRAEAVFLSALNVHIVLPLPEAS